MTSEAKADHARIYLQPQCCEDPTTGRQWCHHGGVWDCDVSCTEYVRADIYEALRARLEVVEAENVRLSEAVRKAEQVFYHYADLHMKKGTADGNQKGAVNLAYSMEMGEALAQQENET